jgi:hypothetical protein
LEDAAILVDIGHVVQGGAVPIMMELHVGMCLEQSLPF